MSEEPMRNIDPAELWERYLLEVSMDDRSPQGAMAFAADIYQERVAELEAALRKAPRATSKGIGDPVAYIDWFFKVRGNALPQSSGVARAPSEEKS